MSQNLVYDSIIIGAGPAGLLASKFLKERNRTVLIVECGKNMEERDRLSEIDLVAGVGGAGLYTDGKLSYYPSGTKLWELESKETIKSSYEYLLSFFETYGVSLQPWSPDWISGDNAHGLANHGMQKRFHSDLIPFDIRKRMIMDLQETIGKVDICEETNVLKITQDAELYYVTISRSAQSGSIVSTRSLIYAGGRLGPIGFFEAFPQSRRQFVHYEVGIRLECESGVFDAYSDEQVDYKIIQNVLGRMNVEARTFCCCRDGQILKSNFRNMRSFHGNSYTGNSTLSNIGIHVRVIGQENNEDLLSEITNIMRGEVKSFQCSIADFLQSCRPQFLGAKLDKIIRTMILNSFPRASVSEGTICGPTIEGVGFYPTVDGNLRYPGAKIWIPGDSAGLFRGQLQAMISGLYVAQQVDQVLDLDLSEEDVYIKPSPTEDLPLVFTAQSKTFFYCRDAICQFVLEKGYLPINPFRVFDYFLGDRVERDLIRKGNNQLIKICNELWVFGPVSDGVLFEIKYAKNTGKQIRFFNIAARSKDIHPLAIEEVSFEPEVHSRQIKREALLKFISSESQKHLFDRQLMLNLGYLKDE